MAAEGKKMGLALVCADGRLHQETVHYNKQITDALGVDLVDILAVPGPDGLYKAGREAECAAVIDWVKLLVSAHHLVAIAIVGHYNCAGNPVSDTEHNTDTRAATEQIKKELTDFAGKIVAFLSVCHSDENWSLQEIAPM